MSLFALASIVGSALGATAMAWVDEDPRLGWRWIQWIQGAATIVLLPVMWVVMKETRGTPHPLLVRHRIEADVVRIMSSLRHPDQDRPQAPPGYGQELQVESGTVASADDAARQAVGVETVRDAVLGTSGCAVLALGRIRVGASLRSQSSPLPLPLPPFLYQTTFSAC